MLETRYAKDFPAVGLKQKIISSNAEHNYTIYGQRKPPGKEDQDYSDASLIPL